MPPPVSDGDLVLGELRRKVAANPKDPGLRVEIARRYEALDHWELAAEHYQAATMLSPADGALAISLAKSYRKRDMSTQASAVLTQFVANNPEAPGPYWSWAGILADEAGQYVEAEEFHRQAVYRSEMPEAFLHNNLGHNLLLQGRRGDAANEFRKALALQPRLEVARNNLAVALSDPSEALIRARGSDPASRHNNRAAQLVIDGRYVQARLELQIALSYRPDHPAALRNLSILSSLDGKPPMVDLLSKEKLAALGASERPGNDPDGSSQPIRNPQEKTNP